MTKREIAEIYQKMCPRYLTREQAIGEMEEFLMVMEKALLKDKKITFPNVGTIKIIEFKPKKIADPNTKEPMIIHPPKDIKFKESVTKK